MGSQDSTVQGGGARLVVPRRGCIEVIYEGVVNGTTVRHSVQQLQRMATREAPLYLLVDGTGISDYDAGVRDEGRALLEAFRDAGGREVVMVLSSAVHRLLGATVAMIVRMPIKIFATRAEALRYIEGKLERP
jgi:hypothetical protein